MKKVKVVNYREECLICGESFTAPTEKRLLYVLNAHKRDKHSLKVKGHGQ